MCKAASGFLYYVSLKGVTGSNQLNIKKVEEKIKEIRAQSTLPLAVGFGIKDAEVTSIEKETGSKVDLQEFSDNAFKYLSEELSQLYQVP